MGKYLEKTASLFAQVDLCTSVYPKGVLNRSVSHYKLRISNIKVLEFGLPKREFSILSILWYYAKLAKLLYAQVRKWDILYIFLPSYAGVIASVICRMLGKRYFVYIGADWRESFIYIWRWSGTKKKILFPIYCFLNGYFEKKVMKYSAFTLVHGNALQKKYKNLEEKIVQTAPIIDLSRIDIFRRSSSIESNRIKCLFIGALIPRKGITYLIQALSILRDKGYKVTLNLVGARVRISNEHYEKKLRELIDILNLNQHVTFTGYVPHGIRLLEIYRNSDIFVLPTLSEGFPRVLYESMSQSLPIVTTNVGGISGLMKHEVNALLVPPKNSEAIAYAIERLITNKKLREKLIANGLKTTEEVLKKDAGRQMESLLIKFIPSYKEWLNKKPKLAQRT